MRVIYLGGLADGSTLLRLLGELPGVCASEKSCPWQRGVAERTLWMRPGILGVRFLETGGQGGLWRLDQIDGNRIRHLKARSTAPHDPRLSRQKLPPGWSTSPCPGYYVRVARNSQRERLRCHCRLEKRTPRGVLPEQVPGSICVIHLVRDSPAVAYSWTTKVARPEPSARAGWPHGY